MVGQGGLLVGVFELSADGHDCVDWLLRFETVGAEDGAVLE